LNEIVSVVPGYKQNIWTTQQKAKFEGYSQGLMDWFELKHNSRHFEID